jgi:hypothetical protein
MSMKKFSLFPHFYSRQWPVAAYNLYLIAPEELHALHFALPAPIHPSQDTSHNVQVLTLR